MFLMDTIRKVIEEGQKPIELDKITNDPEQNVLNEENIILEFDKSVNLGQTPVMKLNNKEQKTLISFVNTLGKLGPVVDAKSLQYLRRGTIPDIYKKNVKTMTTAGKKEIEAIMKKLFPPREIDEAIKLKPGQLRKTPNYVPNIKSLAQAEFFLKKKGIKYRMKKVDITEDGAIFVLGKKEVAAWFKEDKVLLLFVKGVNEDFGNYVTCDLLVEDDYAKISDVENDEEAKWELTEHDVKWQECVHDDFSIKYIDESELPVATYFKEELLLIIPQGKSIWQNLIYEQQQAKAPEANKVVVSVEFLQDTPNVKSVDKLLKGIKADQIKLSQNKATIRAKGTPESILSTVTNNAKVNDIKIKAAVVQVIPMPDNKATIKTK